MNFLKLHAKFCTKFFSKRVFVIASLKLPLKAGVVAKGLKTNTVKCFKVVAKGIFISAYIFQVFYNVCTITMLVKIIKYQNLMSLYYGIKTAHSENL